MALMETAGGEFVESETTTAFEWFFEDSSGQSVRFGNSDEIETAFQSGQKNIKYNTPHGAFAIFFDKMIERNFDTDDSKPVKRTQTSVQRELQIEGLVEPEGAEEAKADQIPVAVPQQIASEEVRVAEERPNNRYVWEFQRSNGAYQQLSQSAAIEAAFNKGEKSVLYEANRQQYNLDFGKMLQRNCGRGCIRRVRRVLIDSEHQRNPEAEAVEEDYEDNYGG